MLNVFLRIISVAAEASICYSRVNPSY